MTSFAVILELFLWEKFLPFGTVGQLEKALEYQLKAIKVVEKVLDENLDTFTVEKVSHSLKTQIQKARVANKLSQKELAQKINVTQRIIQSYENGTAIPNAQVLQKLRQVLKTKLKK